MMSMLVLRLRTFGRYYRYGHELWNMQVINALNFLLSMTSWCFSYCRRKQQARWTWYRSLCQIINGRVHEAKGRLRVLRCGMIASANVGLCLALAADEVLVLADSLSFLTGAAFEVRVVRPPAKTELGGENLCQS
jgi:hypothetical protein